MKSKAKKILAFLCAIVITVTSVANWKRAGTVNATDSETTEVTPVFLDGFTTISTNDFVDSSGKTMESKQYTSDSSFTLKELANFDETLLTFKVKFEATGASTRIEFWGKSDAAFFYVYPLSTSQLITSQAGVMTNGDPAWRLKIENTDITSTINEEYLLQISTQYKDYDEDGTMDGVQMGLYLNGIQVNLVDLKDCNLNNFGNRLTVRVGGSPVTISGVETTEEKQTYVELEGFQTISVHDFVDSNGNVMKGQRCTSSSSYTLKDLTNFDKTLLTLKVKFEDLGSATRIEFWGKDDNAYFFVNPSSTSQLYTGQVGTMTNGDAYWSLKTADTDIESTINQEYILQISTQYKDYDGDGTNDGVQMGLYLNGVRVNLVDLKDCNMDNFGNRLTIRCDGAPVKVHHVDTEEEEEPAIRLAGFRYVTLDAFTDSNGNPMESKTYTESETFTMSEIEGFDRTLLTMKVKFEAANASSRIEFLGINDTAFYYVYPSSASQLLLAPNAANTMNTMEDPYFSLKLENLMNNELSSTINEEYILQISTEYLDDNQVQMGVYLNGGCVRTLTMTECDMTKFGNRLTVRVEGSPITISAVGATEELGYTLLKGFQNVSVNDLVDGDGNPMESKTYTSTETFTLEEYASFDKTLLSLKVKFEAIGTDNRIEFWGIDDDAFYYVYPNSVSKLMLAPNAANTVTAMGDPYFSLFLSNLQHKEVSSTINEECILQISTEYKENNVVQANIYLNGALVRECTIESCNMNEFGNRLTIRTTGSPITISGVETEGNAHLDEEMDVRDLVATIKAGEGLALKNQEARLEADADGSGTIDVNDADMIRERLLQSILIKDSDVMPIAGFFGPYLKYLESSWYEYDFPNRITDTYFKQLSDAGVNLITYSDLNYAKSPYLVGKSLDLSAKYRMGYFVYDSKVLMNIGATDISATELSARIQNYSIHDAFCGMFLVDEPESVDYPVGNTSSNLISTYKGLSNVLQNQLGITCSQSPLNVWNLTKSGVKEGYEKYLAEYCETLSPTYLTWAYYPFSANASDGLSAYFYNLDIMRTYANKYGIPYWSSIQAGAQWNDDWEYLESEAYYPNESEFDWNVNTALAYGAKGISYFPLVQPEHFALATDGTKNYLDFERNGLIGASGTRNQWWYYARKINQHITVIDEVLMNSEHKGIIVTDETVKTSDMSYVTCFKSKEDYGISAVDGNAMIGCFDYQGKTALYVVNYSMESQQNITLTFDTAHNITLMQNAKISSDNLSELTLDMAAGGGVLLVLE